MKKFYRILLIIIILFSTTLAVAKISTTTQFDYKKYKKLSAKYPEKPRYLFEYAMVLAYMGRVEDGGKALGKIADIDPDYAVKIVKYLELYKKKHPDDWKNNFKLGFTYYFLYEEANGRLLIAYKRIKRAKENGDNDLLETESQIAKDKEVYAASYRKRSLTHLELVAEKEPVNEINAWGYTYMSVVEGISEDWETAEEYCKKALKIEPDAYAIRAAYMEVLKKLGRKVAATGQLAMALKLKVEQDRYEKKLFGDDF